MPNSKLVYRLLSFIGSSKYDSVAGAKAFIFIHAEFSTDGLGLRKLLLDLGGESTDENT